MPHIVQRGREVHRGQDDVAPRSLEEGFRGLTVKDAGFIVAQRFNTFSRIFVLQPKVPDDVYGAWKKAFGSPGKRVKATMSRTPDF